MRGHKCNGTTKHVQQFGYERLEMAEGYWELYFYPALTAVAIFNEDITLEQRGISSAYAFIY